MTAPSAKLLVFACEKLACVKIVGRANVGASIDFKNLVNQLVGKGFSHVILELSECLLMDSTFLGVLSGFGLRFSQGQNGTAPVGCLELLNPNLRIADLLDNLGVSHLFFIRQAALETVVSGAKEEQAPCAEHSREEVTSNCLEAHRTLIAMSADNAIKFKDVAQFLAEDLKKLRAAR